MTVTLTDLLPSFGIFAGAGGFGAVMGYAVKKVLKLLTIIVGIVLAPVFGLLAYLSYRGIITVNWTELYNLLTGTTIWAMQGIAGLIQTVSLAVPAVGGLAAGFAIGFHKG